MKEIFEKYGIEISQNQEEKLRLYYKLLTEWNKKINLTSITEKNDVIKKHFLDSAILLGEDVKKALASVEDINLTAEKECSLLDVGTGAGFPGVVLAIIRPNWRITLLDSTNKKISFLNTVKEKLNLKNITTLHGRAEEAAREEEHRQAYDIVTSRAVAELNLLLELCIPFVKKDGCFISYKGPGYKEEISGSQHAMQELNCAVKKAIEIKIEKEDRALIIFEKTDDIPERYPRRAGIPAKRPL